MLLGMRVCEHDTNFALWDGERVRYHKTERTLKDKHHAQDNLWEWQDTIKRVFGVWPDQLTEIAIAVDPWRHKLPTDEERFFPSKPFPYINAPCPVTRVNHHWAHALSTWMIQPQTDVQIVVDGFGDYDVAWSVFRDGELVDTGSVEQDGSIGHLMYWAGTHLGVKADHAEDIAGKLMGLQSYGRLDEKYLEYTRRFGMRDLHEMFDLRTWNKHLDSDVLAGLRSIDWIRTLHERVGEILVDFVGKYAQPHESISYTGGVAQNVIWNTGILHAFPQTVIPPHCADEGLSLGLLEFLRIKHKLAPFKLPNFPYVQTDVAPDAQPSADTIRKTAAALAAGKVVAWYQGNGEVGPRALGNRSILAHPGLERSKINTIKRREGYRPFGATILEEHKNTFTGLVDNPYMLSVGHTDSTDYPAVTHVDGTCRAQTLGTENPLFRKLLEEFYALTGLPLLLNTSLNLAGEPIAATPEQARELFHNTDIDVLVIGDEYATA